jgi:hypothetical protein
VVLPAVASALLLFVCCTVLPSASGFAAALLVFLTPTFKGQLWVARTIVTWPFRFLDKGLTDEIDKEVQWVVQARYGPLRVSYKKALGVARSRYRARLQPELTLRASVATNQSLSARVIWTKEHRVRC